MNLRLCDFHSDGLRFAIAVHGLEGLISEDSKEASYKASRMMAGDINLAYFDPLVAASTQIVTNALRMTNGCITVDGSVELVEICPVCHLKHDEWIDYAAEDVKLYYDEQVRMQSH